MRKIKKCTKFSGVFYCNKKVIQFPSREDYITDEDILDLFMGLVELIKKNTEIKTEQKYQYIIQKLKRELSKAKY